MKKLIITLVVSIILLYPLTALADFGPKSRLDIYIENAPNDENSYYLDLLTIGEYGMDTEYDVRFYKNEEMFRLLWNYDEDGYQATMTHQGSWLGGIRGYLYGQYSEGYMLHDLFQVPSTFKIIIVTSDGDIRVSQVYHKFKFHDTIYLDYETMEITPAGGSIAVNWLLQFLETFSATILIEGVILLLFGFRLKYNWKPFLLVNLSTQVSLIITSGLIMTLLNYFTYILLFLFLEIIIIAAESIAYKKFLIRDKADGRVAYAITANIISLFLSFIVILSVYFS